MRKLALCLMLAALTFSASTKKSMTAPVHMVMTPSAIQWADAPPNLPKGAAIFQTPVPQSSRPEG